MDEFKPSAEFVAITMKKIAVIPVKRSFMQRLSLAGTHGFIRYVCPAGALLVGIVNLVRLLATVYAPSICH
jgi:hypothetical protein